MTWVRWRWPFAAITFGHAIVGTHALELNRLGAHERVSVRQSGGQAS